MLGRSMSFGIVKKILPIVILTFLVSSFLFASLVSTTKSSIKLDRKKYSSVHTQKSSNQLGAGFVATVPDKLRVEKSVFDEKQEWYLAETITHVSKDSKQVIAHNANSIMVKFKITESHLILYNAYVNIHDAGVSNREKQDPVGGEILSRFPIESHFDIATKIDDPARTWKMRTHMSVRFSEEKIESRAAEGILKGETYHGYVKQFEHGGDILKLDISKGKYIDLVVTKQISTPEHTNDHLELRKFLIPVKKSSYNPKPIHEKWTDHLGFFTTQIKHFDKDNIATKKLLINRWDTSKPNITFYFAKSWDTLPGQKYKPLMIQAVSEWNKVFKQKLGLDNFILLKDSDGSQTLGDLRFNMIEWPTKDQSFAGFGPSLSDPLTGEILNANLIINFSGFSKLFYQQSQQKTAANSRKTDLNQEMISAQLYQLASSVPESSTLAASQFLNDIWDRKLDDKAINFNEQNSKINNLLKESNKSLRHIGVLQALMGTHESIKLKDDDNDVDKYLRKVLLNTFMHELGHALGLIHNLKGSMDKNNFYKERSEAGEYQYRQSSVMDYVDDVSGMLDKPGLYDLAAIEKGYSDAKIHDLEQIPSQKKEQDKYFQDQFPFEFCSDIHIKADPMCNMYDQGTSATEIAQFYLRNYQEDYALRNQVYAHLKEYFNDNYHSNYVLYLSHKYFIPMRTFVDFWAKKRLEFTGDEGEFIKTKEGEDLTKAAKISLEFMFSALYNPSDDLTKMNADGSVALAGTLYDRLLALNFLNMKTAHEVIDESSFFKQQVNYYDFAKIIGEQEEYLNKYLTAINGVFTRYEPYLGFETRDEAEIYFINPLIRNMAAGQVLLSELKDTNINRNFHIVVETKYGSQLATLKQTEEELFDSYENLKKDYLPVVTTSDFLDLEQTIGAKFDLLADKHTQEAFSAFKEVQNKYHDPKSYLNVLGLSEKFKAPLAEIKKQMWLLEQDSSKDRGLKKSIIDKISELKKMVMFETNPGIEIDLKDPNFKKSLESLTGYKKALVNYKHQKELLGIHSINWPKLSVVNEKIKNLTTIMEQNFTPIVDPINLLNDETINHVQIILRLKPGYQDMYLEDPEAFKTKLAGLDLEQIEQEYMKPVEELPKADQKIVLTCIQMLKIYDEIKNKTRSFDDSLEVLISLNEKLFLEQKLLDGTLVGVMGSKTYEKLLWESEKKNQFSKSYYQKKSEGLKNLVELEKLENEKTQILSGSDTLRIVDYAKGHMIKTPSVGVTANLVYRISRIDDIINALKQESGNEETILDLQEYKEYELNYLELLSDLYNLK